MWSSPNDVIHRSQDIPSNNELATDIPSYLKKYQYLADLGETGLILGKGLEESTHVSCLHKHTHFVRFWQSPIDCYIWAYIKGLYSS